MKKEPLEISGMHNGASSRMYKNAAKLRSTMTDAEAKLWEYLKTSPEGFKFRRQHPIAGYILDFYCHKLRLSIELDGGYHLTAVQRQKDAERTAYLNDLGILELRFANDVITDNREEWIVKFSTNLREGSPFRVGERAGITNDQR
jgi:very-short-patch-repair endonuclease